MNKKLYTVSIMTKMVVAAENHADAKEIACFHINDGLFDCIGFEELKAQEIMVKPGFTVKLPKWWEEDSIPFTSNNSDLTINCYLYDK